MAWHIFWRHWRMTSKVRNRTSRDTENENKRRKFIKYSWMLYLKKTNGYIRNIFVILYLSTPSIVYMTLANFSYPMYTLWFYCTPHFILFDFPIFRFWRTWWRLFRTRVMRPDFDICVSFFKKIFSRRHNV